MQFPDPRLLPSSVPAHPPPPLLVTPLDGLRSVGGSVVSLQMAYKKKDGVILLNGRRIIKTQLNWM